MSYSHAERHSSHWGTTVRAFTNLQADIMLCVLWRCLQTHSVFFGPSSDFPPALPGPPGFMWRNERQQVQSIRGRGLVRAPHPPPLIPVRIATRWAGKAGQQVPAAAVFISEAGRATGVFAHLCPPAAPRVTRLHVQDQGPQLSQSDMSQQYGSSAPPVTEL